MLLFLKSSTQQINMPAVYSSLKLKLNSQSEAEGNKIHAYLDEHLTSGPVMLSVVKMAHLSQWQTDLGCLD